MTEALYSIGGGLYCVSGGSLYVNGEPVQGQTGSGFKDGWKKVKKITKKALKELGKTAKSKGKEIAKKHAKRIEQSITDENGDINIKKLKKNVLLTEANRAIDEAKKEGMKEGKRIAKSHKGELDDAIGLGPDEPVKGKGIMLKSLKGANWGRVQSEKLEAAKRKQRGTGVKRKCSPAQLAALKKGQAALAAKRAALKKA